MKKLALVLVLVCAISLYAAAQEPSIYVTTLYIERVFPTTLGYRIDYRRQNSLMLATSYLPIGWFGGPTALARVVYAEDTAVPFINIFFRDAEISHMVLYVHRDIRHLSWGTLRSTEGLAERFAIDRPQFQY